MQEPQYNEYNVLQRVYNNMSYLYVKLDVPNHYVEMGEQMTHDLYDNLGSTYDDFINNKWTLLSEEQKKFHFENPNLGVKEVFDMELPKPHVMTIGEHKETQKEMIDQFADSEQVKQFTIGKDSEWFEEDTLCNLNRLVKALQTLKKDTVKFYLNGKCYEFTTSQLDNVLAEINVYKNECNNAVFESKQEIDALKSEDEVLNYDFKAKFPKKLVFKNKK